MKNSVRVQMNLDIQTTIRYWPGKIVLVFQMDSPILRKPEKKKKTYTVFTRLNASWETFRQTLYGAVYK